MIYPPFPFNRVFHPDKAEVLFKEEKCQARIPRNYNRQWKVRQYNKLNEGQPISDRVTRTFGRIKG